MMWAKAKFMLTTLANASSCDKTEVKWTDPGLAKDLYLIPELLTS